MFAGGAAEGSDERGGEFHLRIVAAQGQRFLDEAVAVNAGGGIVVIEPLSVGLYQIAEIKQGEGVLRGFSSARTSVQPGEQFPGSLRILAGVEGGAAQGLHAHDDRSVGVE